MNMNLLAVVVAAVAGLAGTSGDYVPGQPGAAWSTEEMLVVRAKLFSLYRRRQAPKALRLAFHDCLKYEDGTGGCDGCLNWKGVDVDHNPTKYSKSKANVEASDNNGLGPIVRELERIYRESDYPTNTPKLGTSLYESKKSRADLWAYAAIVAVEYGMETTNIACQNANDPRVLQRTCVHDPEVEECFIRPQRSLRFDYGRSDCIDHDPVDTYKTTKAESHPNPVANGKATVDFFRSDFNFNGRETAAIFGAHTFGVPHIKVSLFPYTWTSSGIHLFNNDYYKSITGQPRWFFDDAECQPIGDAYGNRPQSRWLAHSRKMTERGGPVFWIHQNLVCPALYNPRPLSKHDQQCVDEAGPDMLCRADTPSGGETSRTPDQPDGDVNRGCERFRLIIGRDEIALNCEMGLYREFEVTDGVIHGCEGLEHFNASMANDDKKAIWSKLPGQGNAQPLCEKQRLAEPAGSAPLYQIMDEFANDQSSWINEFIPALEKMMRNGYANDLAQAPEKPVNMHCPLPLTNENNMILCYETSQADDQLAFMIANRFSKLSGKVYQYNTDTGLFDFAPVTGENNQLWKHSVSQKQLINVATGQPLAVEGNVDFTFEQVGDDFIAVNPLTGLAVDCNRARVEGKECRTWKRHGRPNQRFFLIIPE